MPDSVCRLTVQIGGGAQEAVDLALPSKVYVGQLIPSIVDIVHRDGITPVPGARWRLSRLGGEPLDESMTLEESDIRDGELLLLTTYEPPPPQWVVADPVHTLAQIDNTHGGSALRILSVIGCLTMAAVGAVALVWSSAVTATASHAVTGTGLAVAAAVGAVVARRAHPDPLLCVTLGVVAVMFTAAAGFLAVPAGPLAAHALLAATAAFSVAILLLRLLSCGTISLTAIATFTVLIAAVSTTGCAWHLPAAVAGAVLSTLSLATLAAAPRFSIAVAGIGPSPPSTDDSGEPAIDVVASRAVRAHETLTGLVIGSSAGASLGAAMVAFGEFRDSGSFLLAAAFTAVIGLVLALRARTHVETERRIALCAGGMISVTAGFAVGIVALPEHGHWVGLLAAAAGVGALTGLVGLTVSPLARRAVELLEYLVLAAVVPLTCWVGGLFDVVRGMALI